MTNSPNAYQIYISKSSTDLTAAVHLLIPSQPTIPSAFLPASRNPHPIVLLSHKPIIQQAPLRPRPTRHLKIKLEHQHRYELADFEEADVFTQAVTGTFAELFFVECGH